MPFMRPGCSERRRCLPSGESENGQLPQGAGIRHLVSVGTSFPFEQDGQPTPPVDRGEHLLRLLRPVDTLKRRGAYSSSTRKIKLGGYGVTHTFSPSWSTRTSAIISLSA